MPNRVVKDLITYGKNVGKHVKRLAQNRESFRDAIDELSKDSDKLLRAVKNSRHEGEHLEAARLVERGRRKYNEKSYREAEDLFREAIAADPQYALAYTYLGYTLYRLERVHDAVQVLTRAIEMDPGSEAAHKAEKRLKTIQLKKENLISALEHRLKPEE